MIEARLALGIRLLDDSPRSPAFLLFFPARRRNADLRSE